jgi:hypothetical protein
MKVLDALVNPKGMISHAYNPNLVLKAVFHSSSNFIRIWWYPLRKSTLVKSTLVVPEHVTRIMMGAYLAALLRKPIKLVR